MSQAESLAHAIKQKLKGTEQSYPFYCKVAIRLPEHKIWLLVEQSLQGRSPGALFNYLARREMKAL